MQPNQALILQRSENVIYQQLTVMNLLTAPDKQRQKLPKRYKCQCPQCLKLACQYYDAEEGLCCLNSTTRF